MDANEALAERFESIGPDSGRLPTGCSAPLSEADDAVQLTRRPRPA